MRKNSIFTRLVSLTVAFAMVMTIGGSVFADKKGDITLGTAITVNVNKNSSDWYTFTPTHTGSYTLTGKRTSGSSGYGTIATSTNTTAFNPSWTNRLQQIGSGERRTTLNLNAGTTYGFRVRSSGNTYYDYTFTLSANFATISFNGNGSTSTMNSVYPALNQAYTLPACTMTRDDYEFAGWATSATGDVVYADQASVTPTGDMTLYAKWNKIDEIEATAADYSAQYDGQYHGITINVTEPATGYTIEYRTSTTAQWSTTAPTRMVVGTTPVYWRITAPGYKTLSGQNSINIQNGSIAYSASGYEGAYDGQAHSITVNVTSPTDATIQYSTDGSSWSSTKPEYTNEGTYTVYYYITRSNYASETGSQTVNITSATISYSAQGYTGTYNGQPHGITVSVTKPATGATIEYSEAATGPWSSTAPTFTGVGSHTVYYRITASHYQTVTGHASVVINEATIAYTADGYTGSYDGQPHSISIDVTDPVSGVVIEYRTNPNDEWSTTNPEFTDPGTHTVYYRLSATGYATKTGSVNVVINPGTIVYNAANYTGTYDGQPHSISVTVTTPASGATIQYREQGHRTWRDRVSFTNAGTYTVEYRIQAANYETVTGSATVNIDPAAISYSAQGYSGTYDGQAHSISVTVTTPASGATIQYREQGHHTWRDSVSFTNAGTHTVEYRIQAANYETVTGSATVKIDPAAISYSAQGYSGTYDGQDHTISVSVSAPANAQIRYRNAQGWYTLTNPPTYSAVGTYLVYYRITANNYQTVESSATVEITAADMTVTATGYSAPYDGAAHGIEVEVTTPSSGATVLYGESADACTLTTCPTYSYGEHTVYYLVTAPNYNDYSGSATVSISDIDIAATAEGYDGPYDGEAHGITVTVTEPESGASVMFGTEEGTYDMEVSPVFTEIGDYTVYYQVTAEGHNPLTGSATVSIGELTIDATVTPYDGVFDGAEHGVTVTVNTPEVGATVLFGTEAGVYDLDESPTYCEIGTYTVYYKISAEYYAPLEGSVVVRISENPDRDDAREALIELIAASDEILGEWEDLLPEDLVEALLDAEDAAYEVLNNEIASIEQLEAAADNLANALGNVLQYIAENYETEPELTPEQRTRLCVINFVENLYLHALGRPFDVSGRDTWVSLIMDQGGTGTQVARGFLGSQEFLGLGLDNEGFVKALYNALFNRVPEAEEVDTWTNALAAGVTREEVINAFFASPEWARTCAYYRVNI